MPGLWAEAGERARQRGNFLSRRRKKVTKERATPSLRPLRVAKGQPASGRLRGAPWNSLCACGAPLGQPRRVSQRGMRASTRMLTPQPPRRRRSQQGVGHPNIQQPNSHTGLCFARPHLAGASATRCANWAERSNGPNGCPLPGFPSGCAEERSGQRIRARDCLSATQWSEFERDPAGREHRRFPHTPARACGDAACRVAFSLVTFSWRGKRKLLRRRAHTPAPALQPGMRQIQCTSPGFVKLSPNGQMNRSDPDKLSPNGRQPGICYKNNSYKRFMDKRQRQKQPKINPAPQPPDESPPESSDTSRTGTHCPPLPHQFPLRWAWGFS